MSNPESFIEEVTEEVRRDRLFNLFRKYGWIAVLAVLLIVGGAAYNEWQKADARARAQAFGDSLLGALDQPNPAARSAALQAAQSATQGQADKATLLNLMRATDPQNDRAGAIAALDALVADTSLAPRYRDLAVLRRVILAGAEMEIPARRALLEPLAAPGRPYRTLAQEQMAYLSVEAGDIDAALAQLRSLSADVEAPAGLRQRAAQMIVALGGAVAQG